MKKFNVGDTVMISGSDSKPTYTITTIDDSRSVVYYYVINNDRVSLRGGKWIAEPLLEKVNLTSRECCVRKQPPYITNIYVNESKKCIAVKFSDGDVRVIHCSENDSFDIYVGVALAIAKKSFGSSEKFHSKVDKILKKGNK